MGLEPELKFAFPVEVAVDSHVQLPLAVETRNSGQQS